VTTPPMGLTAIDLFSGAGGLTLGLKQAGFRVLAGIECDALAVESYAINHPEVEVVGHDIRMVDPSDLMDSLGLKSAELDLLAGCPPCQGFSSIRTRRRGTADDSRNDLLFEFLRFVDVFRPRSVLMENVPGLAGEARFSQFVRRLRRRGFSVAYRVVDASQHGVPQRRRRLVLTGGRRVEIRPPRPTTDLKTVAGAIGHLGRPGTSGDPLHDILEKRSERVIRLFARIPVDGGSRAALPPEDRLACHSRTRGFFDVYGRMRWSDVAPTITGGCVSPSKGRFLHPDQNRAITLREAALLQSFPPDYRFSLRRGKYAAAEMIGNALPPEFVRRHAIEIAHALSGKGPAHE
jgi:DNA (cytosine-5)-methyltransferase 1